MNNWTTEEEELLKSWAEKASCYRWMHDKSYKFYKDKNNKLGIPSMVLSLVAGASLFTTINIDNENFEIILKTLIGLMNLCAGVLSGLQNFLKLETIIGKHHTSSINFSNYYRNIIAEISLPKSKREDALVWVKNAKVEFDKLINNAAEIPENIIDDFILQFKDVNISKPDIANGLTKIEEYYEIEPNNNITTSKYESILKLVKNYDTSLYNLILSTNNNTDNNINNTDNDIENNNINNTNNDININNTDNNIKNNNDMKKLLLNNDKKNYNFTNNIV